MKTLPLVSLVALACLLGGCFAVPAPYAEQLNPAAKRYSAYRSGVARTTLEAQLGPPLREQADGSCTWETRIDDLNYTALTVWFDAQGRMQKREVVRAHGVRKPGYVASAESSFTR